MSKKSNSYDEKNWALDVRINAHKNFSITTLEDLIESLTKKIPENSSILDLGCGNGNFYSLLSKVNRYVGLDVSSELLEQFSKSNNDSVPLLKASFDDLPNFVSNSFDAIFSIYSIYYTDAPDILISNLYEILSKNGSLTIIGPSKDRHAPEIEDFLISLGVNVPENKSQRVINLHDVIIPQIASVFETFQSAEIDASLNFPNSKEWSLYVAATPHVTESLPSKKIDEIRDLAKQYSQTHKVQKITKGMTLAEAQKI